MTQLDNYKNFLLARNLSLVYFNYFSIYIKWLEENKIPDDKGYTSEIITKFFGETDYSPSSKNSYLKAGRNYYTSFLGIPKEQNAFFATNLLPTERKIPNFITEEELTKAIKYIATYNDDFLPILKMETFVYFMFYTGMRISELLELKREGFDFEKNEIKFHRRKTKEESIIPLDLLPQKIIDKIKQYFNAEKEEGNAFSISEAQIRKLTSLMGKYLNKRVYPHLLRHSNARNLIEKGYPLQAVMFVLGHKSIKTTEIYTTPNLEMVKRICAEKQKKINLIKP